MDWEVYDYRKKPKPPTWFEWTPVYRIKYCVLMIFFLFVVPFLFGFSFSALGLLINVLLLDYIWWRRAVDFGEY